MKREGAPGRSLVPASSPQGTLCDPTLAGMDDIENKSDIKASITMSFQATEAGASGVRWPLRG
jgi:hypothetical protein